MGFREVWLENSKMSYSSKIQQERSFGPYLLPAFEFDRKVDVKPDIWPPRNRNFRLFQIFGKYGLPYVLGQMCQYWSISDFSENRYKSLF